MSVFYNDATKRARLDAVVTQAGTTAVLEILTAESGILASFSLNNPIGAASGSGLLLLSGFPKAAVASASGVAALARIRTGTGGTDIVTGLTVGVSGTASITLSTTTIVSGATIRLASAALAVYGAKLGANLGGLELASGARYGASTRPNLNLSAARAQDIKYLGSCGFSRTRLPIVWELLQPVLASSTAGATVRNGYSPALSSNGALYEGYAGWIDDILDAHAAVGMTCIIDLHNYCRYMDFVYQGDGTVLGFTAGTALVQPYTTDGSQVTQRIMSKAAGATLTVADFQDVWTRIVNRWKDHPGCGGWGLMNEPNSMPAVGGTTPFGSPEDLTIWPYYAQQAINTIRAIESTVPIYVSGNQWSNTQNWVSLNPGYPLTGANLVYEAHLYIDMPGTGHEFDWTYEASQGATVNDGVNRLTPFVNWLKRYGAKGALGEYGMPVGHVNWVTSYLGAADLAIANNVEMYTWVGGSAWSYRSYPVNHIPQWHQNKLLEPEVGGVLKKALNVTQVTLFVDGGGWGGAAGTTVNTIRVCARGYCKSDIVLTVASDNGGTLSKSTLTIPAGANQMDTFTFTPVANRKSVLTFTMTSPAGITAPVPHVVYSHTDPVTLSSTNLPDAAMTLLAKYAAAKWVAADAYTDFIDGGPAASGNEVRAIADTGYMSTFLNPMEMVNFNNMTTGSLDTIPTLGVDGNSKKYVLFNTDQGALWCKKVSPLTPADPNPVNKITFNQSQAMFAVVALAITSTAATGVVFQVATVEASARCELMLTAGQPQAHVVNEVGGETTVNGTVLTTNTPTVITLASKQTSQRLRRESVEQGTPGALALATANTFNQMSIGGRFHDYWRENVTNTRIYVVFAGVGDPSAAELGVLERYASSLAGGTL